MHTFRDVIGHVRAINILQSILRTNEVPQALLFKGEDGIGKKSVAQIFTQVLLCQENHRGAAHFIEPCHRCLSCQKIEHQNHPDFSIVAPEESLIKIDQIREVQGHIVFKPIEGPKRVVLIDDADRMNGPAANSLLKTLEEPPPYVLLILVTSRPDLLPETLLSRCQKIPFHALSLSQIETILVEKRGWRMPDARLVAVLARGRLGDALGMEIETAREREAKLYTLLSDETLAHCDCIFDVATAFAREEKDMEVSLCYLFSWFRDVLAVQAAHNLDPSLLLYPWRYTEIKTWAARMDSSETWALLAEIRAIWNALGRNINRELALEALMMRLKEKTAGHVVSSG